MPRIVTINEDYADEFNCQCMWLFKNEEFMEKALPVINSETDLNGEYLNILERSILVVMNALFLKQKNSLLSSSHIELLRIWSIVILRIYWVMSLVLLHHIFNTIKQE